MKKAFIFGLLVVFLVVFSLVAFAQKPQEIPLPDKAGIYDVPGRPDLKLRVFLHPDKPAKSGKPTPTTPPYTCTETDPDSLLPVDLAGWKLPNSWIVKLNVSSVPSTVGGSHLLAIVDNAFREWLTRISNKVTVIYTGTTNVSRANLDGQNIITWGNAPASALAVSYIWYNGDGYAVEVDTIMNKKYTWYWSQDINCAYQNVYDAQDILTHELGHTFGLDDMYTNDYANHTMYGYGSKGEVKKDTLTPGDITSVQNIYK